MFPQQLKLGEVIALPRKIKKVLPENYRATRLLRTTSKIFEKVINKRIYSFFSKITFFTKSDRFQGKTEIYTMKKWLYKAAIQTQGELYVRQMAIQYP